MVSCAVRAVIVDDAADLRLLVRAELTATDQFDIVGEAGDGREALDVVTRVRPDLVLLDVSMPGMDGLEALALIRAAVPETRVVMYTGFAEGGLAERAVGLGAAALIEKSTALDRLPGQLLEILDRPAAPRPRPRPSGPPRLSAAGQALLDEHLERFREVFEEAAIGMATMTLTGQVVRANKALSALVGRSVGDLVGVPYSDLAHPSDGPGIGRALAAAHIAAMRFEHSIDTPSGARRVLATAAPVKDSRDRALYLFLQAQDITRQRSAEEALRLSEERFRLLVEAVQDYAIFMLDPDGHVVSWNAGAQRIKRYRAEQIIGQHFRVFYPAEQQRSRHPEHELEIALRDGHYEEEGWRIRSDGSRFWASVVITAVHTSQGQHIGFAKITRDMTERRETTLEQRSAAAALATSHPDLEAANVHLAREAADQAEFLAVTAHELRTPASVIVGSARLLAAHWDQMEEHERDDIVRSVTASADRLQRLLDDLLTASRLESKAMRLHPVPVDVAGLLNAAAAAARAATPDARVDVSVPPALTVIADADRIAQAVDNLVGNALRHGAAPVTVTARAAGENRVEIVVRDAGPGVAQELRGRLFERFATGGRRRGGTGLGLFIVRELARAHGGDAWYDEGDGFVLSLPAGWPA